MEPHCGLAAFSLPQTVLGELPRSSRGNLMPFQLQLETSMKLRAWPLNLEKSDHLHGSESPRLLPLISLF